MSLLDQLTAALADGTISKGKAKVRNKRKPTDPNKLKHIKGEKHPFIARTVQPVPPTPKPSFYMERKIIMHGKFVLPVLAHYMPEELKLATYSPFDFIGTSPQWATHLTITGQ